MGQQASLQLPIGSGPKYACIPRKEDDEFPSLFQRAGSRDFDRIEADLGGSDHDSFAEGIERPIHHAARENRKDRIVLLARGGADVGAKSPTGCTALHIAAVLGHKDVCRELIRLGAPLDERNKVGQTPLHLASTMTGSRVCKAHTLDMLLNHGAYIDAVDKNGRTPLHIASMEGQLNIVTRLCAKGAKRGPADKDGKAPSDLAQDFGHQDIVAFFQTVNKTISNQKIKKYEEYL